MNKIILLTCLLAVSTAAYSQYDFLLEKKSLNEIRLYEDSLKSIKLGYVKTNVGANYFPTAKEKHDYYPLSFKRTNDGFYPELHVEYYYSESDSSLLATSYDWNIMDYVSNFKTDGDKFEKEKLRKKEYLAKYDEIYKYLVSELGQPQSAAKDKNSSGYFYKIVWEKDKIEVLVLLKFSTQLKYLPDNMIFGSYNIRVKVDYKK